MKSGGILLVLCAVAAVASLAQTTSFRTLAAFDGSNGSGPGFVALARGSDGGFYGTTTFGGQYAEGTVFKVTPSGQVTVLYNFCPQDFCFDGAEPNAGLILGTDGNFYGTTSYGGANFYYGTVFRITPAGTLTTVYSFKGYPDGSAVVAPVVQGTDGNFYGTTELGGQYTFGTVFKVTPAGQETILHSFTSAEDGGYPYAGLIRGSDGNFYGTSFAGGHNQRDCGGGCGTAFRITASGTLTRLYSFCSQPGCVDGARPWGGLLQGRDGNFYGTTYDGGAASWGTIFKLTPGGSLTTLHTFCLQNGCPDGVQPVYALVQGSDGSFYGSASSGGALGFNGTLFRITSQGSLTTLHTFDGNDGRGPWGGMVQAPDGFFYGVTSAGGPGSNAGTIFRVGVVCASVVCGP